ncbi:Fe-S oxidoreductase [Candidatus Scalindua japonica]|uniref:Fe-S oxidoreductase n=2 Tax=Candidatus Scalindua japonica TaxID=1284222 RepID=A0A286U242_9BACT|nr:Fe-S oxidoreductase [Candidatus Scalindua japonica]
MFGARYLTPPLGLITVASLLPDNWNVRLIDCNVSSLTTADIEWSDIVFSSGMVTQQDDHLALIKQVKDLNKFHVIGGPDPTARPDVYENCDSLVLGEAEVSLPLFLKDYFYSTPESIYKSSNLQADMKKSPAPRFDLLEFERYLYLNIQTSRGCPFSCEYCNISMLNGVGHRAKSIKQVLLELQQIYDLGYRGVMHVVDSNFIGNEQHAKEILLGLKDWQDARRRPYLFSTDVSINLADDKELLIMMREAGFNSVNIGIETPNRKTLLSSYKKVNVNRSMPQNIREIYKNGISVIPYYVLGFDNDDKDAFVEIMDCIEKSDTPLNYIRLLVAIPETALAERLKKEGRLHKNFDVFPENGDVLDYFLNFETLRPREEILEEYMSLFKKVYSPANFFRRLRNSVTMLGFFQKAPRLPKKKMFLFLKGAIQMFAISGILSSYKYEYWKTLFYCSFVNYRALPYTIGLIACYHQIKLFESLMSERFNNEIFLLKKEMKSLAN